MPRKPSRDPWELFRTAPAAKPGEAAYLNDLRDAAHAASPDRRAALLDHIMTVMLTAGRLSHPGIRVEPR